MGLLGYKKRTSFLAGLAVAQISEFSLIIAALGFNLGHLDETVLSLITLVGIITIGISTYMIIYSDKLYNILSPYLGIFEKKETKDEISKYSKLGTYDVILFGGHRIGRVVIDNFKDRKDKLLVIDYNPDILTCLASLSNDEVFTPPKIVNEMLDLLSDGYFILFAFLSHKSHTFCL